MNKTLLVTIIMLWLSFFAYADTPVLHRRTGSPPQPEVSCQDQLHEIRKRLVEVSINESLLWEAYNRQAANFFLVRSHTVQHTKDLNPSVFNCAPTNIKELNIVVAEWEYVYAQDTEKLSAAAK